MFLGDEISGCRLLRLACACLLHCKPGQFLALMAIKCSSFSKMNRGTSKRCESGSIGHTAYRSVAEANTLLERTCNLPIG